MSAGYKHANYNPRWQSRSSSSSSEVVLTTKTSTSASSALSNSWPTSSQPCSHHGAAAATVSKLAGGAVSPLLALQKLPGNAFSLRQVSVPLIASASAPTGVSSTATHSPRVLLSPRRLSQQSVRAAAATKEKDASAATAAASSSYTPNTSPRSEWPERPQPPPSNATPREARHGAPHHLNRAPQAVAGWQRQPQQNRSCFNVDVLSRSFPVPSRHQSTRAAMSARQPQPTAAKGVFAHAQELVHAAADATSHSTRILPVGVPKSADTFFDPPLPSMAHRAEEMASPTYQYAQAYHCGARMPPFLDTIHSGPDTSATTPLQIPVRHLPWQPVNELPLPDQLVCGGSDGAPSPMMDRALSATIHRGSPMSLPPPHLEQHADGGNMSEPCSFPSVPAIPPAPIDSLSSLFQQYIEAQRALEPVLMQLRVPCHKFIPLKLQEAVLEQVQSFAEQLKSQAHLSTPSASCGDNERPLRQGVCCSSYTDARVCPTAEAGEQKATVRDTPRQCAALRKSEDVCWDAILPFLAAPPVGAHATLRAVGPGTRRRLEQHAWSWVVEEVCTAICPFVVENGADEHVRDAYARLDGRERLYVGSVPVARRTPVPVPRHAATAEERRLLDGTVLLDCERQSLLLDRVWREGWLHCRTSSHLRFLSPLFMHPHRLRFLRLNPSRVHVDGAFCDVLRPKRSQHGGANAAGSNAAAGAVGSPCLEDINANTVPRAGLTPRPPPMLDGRPAAALSVTRKLLGDAVSAISRDRGRGADISTRTQLSRRLTSTSAISATAASAAQAREISSSGTLQPDDRHARQVGSQHIGESGGCVGGAPNIEQETLNHLCTPSPQHPYFRHESLPAVVEDVNGTAHVFCTRMTSVDSDATRGLLRGWLQHYHRLRRQPLYSTAADFLLVGHAKQRKRRVLAEGGDTDYVICTAVPSEAEVAERHKLSSEALLSQEMQGAEEARRNGADLNHCDEGVSAKGRAALCPPLLLRDDEQLGCVAPPSSAVTDGACRTAIQHLFHVRLQEWRAKRKDVVRRMDNIDPSWLMVGDCRGPLPRPLALHVTEQHLLWLARELCPDSDGGGLMDLQELHLCVAESLLPTGWVSAWQWCLSTLRSRRNLLVVSIVAAVSPPPMALGSVTEENNGKRAADPVSLPGLSSLSDAVTGPTSALFIEAIFGIPSLQVLDLHGITGEDVALLFPECTAAAAATAGGKANWQSRGGVSCTRLARLRDLYVTVRRGHEAGASSRSAYSGEICLSAAVFPSLQVLWLDAPRLCHLAFGASLVLRELHLISDSSLLCSALRGVEALPCLEVLHVERAVIDDCAFLGDCLALRELLLHACRLSSLLLLASTEGNAGGGGGHVEELHGVERAPNLETLSLCYTEEIKQLSNFARCPSLRRVLLTRCNGISSSSIVGFESLPNLELLALEYTRVSELSHFARAPVLRVLRVDGCKRVLRSSVMGLEMAPHLRELSMQDTNVSTVANFGGGCMALQFLDLSGCRHLDVDGLQGIQALPQLEVLSLSHTPITDVNFLADCLKLTTLYVEGCTELLPTALEDLRSSPVLRKIVANDCPSLTKVGQLGRCRLLEVLSVAGAAALTTAGVEGMERSPRLRFLDLSGTAVHSLRFLARGCRGLCYLSVKGCVQLTSLRELHGVEGLPRLQTLNMENLSVTGRLDFLTVSTSLQNVSFSGCTGLTEEDVRALQLSGISTFIP
ncbi:hypothetical protein ABL78_3100 [Leptomonas seymouri]|uniref:Leucine-rich repeat protein n=1 Tax=Leptomonas seymouri TaxID=5684 RepID=A0A0N1I8A7_LEPSE|nr:hypothetical protein ABL78_3100 [Leptomonas seymouri]|eukprot:KPI87801.1 hypothetical protein ABL78_3100 [Leptomonas seymouri]